MTTGRMSLVCSLVAILVGLSSHAAAQYSPSGLSNAQLKQLHGLNMPVVAPVPAPRGFHVLRVVPNSYDRTYKIFYADKNGATITFQADELYTAQTANAPAATTTPPPAPKRGFFQKLLSAPTKSPTPAGTTALRTGTSSETEGQVTSALVADSQLVGPIKFTPVGPCLQGTADATKGTIRGLRLIVSACNFDNADILISAYKNVQRV